MPNVMGAITTQKGNQMSIEMHTPARLTMTIQEAAQRLGIGRNSAYAAAHDGAIPTIKIGKRMVVPVAALDKMLSGEAPANDDA